MNVNIFKLSVMVLLSASSISCSQDLQVDTRSSQMSEDKTMKSKPGENSTDVKLTLSDMAPNPLGISSSGELPSDSPPNDVIAVQTKFLAALKTGLPDNAFAECKIKPNKSVQGSVNGRKAMRHENGNHKMFLVKSHLVKTDNPTCSTQNAYEGWIAAQPFLSFQVSEPAVQTMFVRPYRVLICNDNGVLDYKVMEIGESLSP